MLLSSGKQAKSYELITKVENYKQRSRSYLKSTKIELKEV